MRIVQILLGAVAAVALAMPALAADLPTRKAAPEPYVPPPPVFSWAGPYLGAFAGGNWASITPNGGEPAFNSNGLTAGGLAGYNWGFNGFVIGAEFEGGYDHKRASVDYLGLRALPHTVTMSGSAEFRERGRLGYAWNSVLFFVAGGFTQMDLKLTNTNNFNGDSAEIGRWRTGFNLGGGVDWAFNDHWVVRGEYIYDGFQSRGYDFATRFPVAAARAGFIDSSVGFRESTARAALIYKF